jgi:hypothetical protein
MTPRQLALLRDISIADSGGMMGRLNVYAYLPRLKQCEGASWDAARMYVGTHREHIPGLCREVTGTARHLMSLGLVELGESGRRKSVRPLILTEAGREFLARHNKGAAP